MRALSAQLLLFLLASPALLPAQAVPPESPALKQAEQAITPANLLRHIRELSSDTYGGRAPGTEGEDKSVTYLVAQCRAIGLEPGARDGGWIQKVALWGMRSQGTINLAVKGKTIPVVAGEDYVVWSSMPVPKVDLTATPIVFVGYGAIAPEYHWNDYAGLDVHGKTVVILSGDPPVADPAHPTQLDSKFFLGRALSVYGRTGTKLDTAYKQGAAAVILVSGGSSTAVPGPNLFQNYTRENMILRGPQEHQHVQAQALLSAKRIAEFFTASGADFETLRSLAAKPGFHGVSIDAEATFHVTSRVRQIDSANVIAKITGSDSVFKNQYVIYSGHWDHHGTVGTQIFHGASDNAAGSAGVLELARAFKTIHPNSRRTILFLWPTAEEKGLLGARYYVEHPLYPLAQTVANINLDYFSNWGWGRTHDFSIVGIGNSTLDDMTAEIVKAQGRTLTGDTAPEQGFYFRSDHYEFARGGVPSIETSPGIDYVGKPADFGVQKRTAYITNDYHQPSDVIKPDWDLIGAVEDLQVLLNLGYRVAQDDARPAWKPDAIWRPAQN